VAGRKITGTPNLLRMVNRNSILHLLEQRPVTSRAELALLSGLSPPTVSAVVRELMAEGWVNELGDGVSQGGKPPQMIGFNVDARMVVAVRVTGKQVETRVSNLANEVIESEVFQPASQVLEPLCQMISRSVVQLLHQARIPWDKVLGVCVSVPGVVDLEGNVSNAPELGWERAAVSAQLSDLLDCDVLVQNDVKLATLGEAWVRGFSHGTMVYLHLDRGIGAGILIDGKLYTGRHFAAGEIGNMVVSPETLRSVSTATSTPVAPGPFERNFGLNALLTDEPGVNADIHEARILNYLVYGLANVISVLDPEMVVFGGEMTWRVEDFVEKVRQRVACLPIVQPEMVLSELGQEGCLIGATRYVLDNFREHVTWTSV